MNSPASHSSLCPIWIRRDSAVPADLCAHLAGLIDSAASSSGSTGSHALTIVDSNDVDIVRHIWEYTQRLVPASFEGCALVGPHPTVRLLQYKALAHDDQPDMYHPVHADTPLAAPGAHSRLTVLLYVSSSFRGGSVRFYGIDGTKEDSCVDVQPSQGTILIFDHRVRHCAAAVTSGIKHLLKLSVLYALEPNITLPTAQISVMKADQDLRLAFSICRRVAAVFARSPLAQHTYQFVGTKEEEFLALVMRAELEKEPLALETARGQLLDFIVHHDLTSWSSKVVGRAFMVMVAALVDPRLKLRAYQAFDAATQLHNDERCILLGETLIKDANDPDPNVRLAAINAFFRLFSFDEGCRGKVVADVIRCDSNSLVRLRALQGIVGLATDACQHETTEAQAEAARGLWDVYGDSLLQVASLGESNGCIAGGVESVQPAALGLAIDRSQADGPEKTEIMARALAIRAITLLSARAENHSQREVCLLD